MLATKISSFIEAKLKSSVDTKQNFNDCNPLFIYRYLFRSTVASLTVSSASERAPTVFLLLLGTKLSKVKGKFDI